MWLGCITGQSTATGAEAAWLDMFARKQRAYEAIPPTRVAFLEHAKRVAYEVRYIWSQSTVCQPETQRPADWDGHGKVTCGKSSGLQTYPLQRAADGPTADPVWRTTNVVEGAKFNVMALVSLAQDCAAVIARCSPDSTSSSMHSTFFLYNWHIVNKTFLLNMLHVICVFINHMYK